MIFRNIHAASILFRIPFVLILIFSSALLSAQQQEFSWFYRVYFRDKGSYNPADFSALELLSERAVERRIKNEITYPDMKDLPIFPEYISAVEALGLTLHCTSKWMNTGVFKSEESVDVSRILALSFISEVKLVKSPGLKGVPSDKLEFPLYPADPGASDRPVTLLNGSALHYSGFDGKGILIAVLDGGFLNGNLISSLQHLRNRKGIKGTYDFVNNDPYVYDYHNHGTAVLSVLAGRITGIIGGTAPGADFLLLRTEDTASEFPVEEDLWAAGAEYADSAGADIISSSLGYFIFDDPAMNYQFSDFDGNRAFVTQAADIAASKGMLVVASAGNERNNEWKRILAPSDGDSVISVGAVDMNNLISSFSSAGFAADGRIKPDNTAMGVSVPVQTEVSSTGRSSGTSFSCPVLSGMSACLMQAVPSARNTDIIEVLHYSADRYLIPDSLYGYGTPDMLRALEHLQNQSIARPEQGSFAWPNPSKGDLEIIFKEAPGNFVVEISGTNGKTLYRKEYGEFAGRSLPLQALRNMQEGIYIIKIETETGTFTHRIIKINN